MPAEVLNIDEESAATRGQRTPRFTRYQLNVVGAGVPDVVDSAGGWLFDRAMAGWDVTVAVPGGCAVAPLRILGVCTVPLEAFLVGSPASRALAVAGPMCGADDRVRRVVAAALRSGRTEVTLWGDTRSAVADGRGDEVRHELSSAARVFKAQASLAAGGDPTPVAPFEVFRSHGRSVPTVYPDLVPIG